MYLFLNLKLFTHYLVQVRQYCHPFLSLHLVQIFGSFSRLEIDIPFLLFVMVTSERHDFSERISDVFMANIYAF